MSALTAPGYASASKTPARAGQRRTNLQGRVRETCFRRGSIGPLHLQCFFAQELHAVDAAEP